jgi:3-phenylpropionate/trans-cinnamate dioxygenase ferredoxin reductase subunit
MGSDAQSGPVLVLGGGLAAISFVTTLRGGGFAGEVCVVETEAEPPYDRPPLSKEFQREGNAEKIRLDTSRAPNVEWLRGRTATAIDTRQRRVRLTDGTELGYGTLVLATGARPREIPALRDAGVPLFTLRTLDDARRIRAALLPAARLLVIGGGVIGLELAATARSLGCEVTVVEATERLMNRCSPTTLSSLVADCHRVHGVDLRLNTQVRGIAGGRITLDDGSTLEVDAVVLGIGVVANDELARAAGIACDDGIFVDAFGRTTCPGVLAIGDVTRQRNPLSGRFERIETWSNAQNQGAAAARALLAAEPAPFAELPWYWSDQFEMKMQVVGLAAGDSEIIRGTPASGEKFALIQVRQGRAVGVACVNNTREFASLKKLLALPRLPDAGALADPSTDLRKTIQAATPAPDSRHP